MTLPTTLTFQSTEIRIIDRNGTPWVPAADLAKALGYKSADSVNRIYTRNKDEFTGDMSETVKLTVSGNLQTETRIFSPRGCHLIAMFARTERAKAFRKWVLDVLEQYAAGRVPDAALETITPSEQQLLRELADQKTAGLGHLRRRAYAEIWSRVHRKFRVSSYKDLPRERLAEVVTYITEMQLQMAPDSRRVTRDEGTLTPDQLNQIREVLRMAFTGWTWRTGDVQHAYNFLRVVFGVTSIEHIPASRFEQALALARQMAGHCERFVLSAGKAREQFLSEVIEGGAPWTPTLASRWREQFREGLPSRVDWQEVSRDLNVTPVPVSV